MNHHYLKRLCLFGLVFLLSGCLKEDDSTVLLPLPLSDIQGVSIPDGLLDQIQVNEGTNPPNIEGQYVADSMTIQYASDDYWNGDYYDLYMAFTAVEGRHVTSYKERQNTANAKTSYARVIGNGDDFTVYFTSDMSDTHEQWSCTTLTIISGTVTPYGIANFQYVNAMLEKEDPHNKIMEIGEFHVFDNRNCIARKQAW